MVKIYILFVLLLALAAEFSQAGLPPTATKGAGDSAYVTTSKFDFSDIPLTHNGSTAVVGTIPVSKGGTGATSLTSNNVILGNGTSAVQLVAPGASGEFLKSDGSTWVSGTATFGTNIVTTPGVTKPVSYSAFVSSVGAVSREVGDLFTTCTNANPRVCTFTSNIWADAPNCQCVVELSVTGDRGCHIPAVSTTSVSMHTNSNATDAAYDANIFCHGVAP